MLLLLRLLWCCASFVVRELGEIERKGKDWERYLLLNIDPPGLTEKVVIIFKRGVSLSVHPRAFRKQNRTTR